MSLSPRVEALSSATINIIVALGVIIFFSIQSQNPNTKNRSWAQFVTAIAIVLSLIGIILSLAVVAGILKRKPIYLLLWLIYNSLTGILFIVYAIIAMTRGGAPGPGDVLFALSILSLIILQLYSVYKYHKILKNDLLQFNCPNF